MFLRAHGRIVCIQDDSIAASFAGLCERTFGAGDELDILPRAFAVRCRGGDAEAGRHDGTGRGGWVRPLHMLNSASQILSEGRGTFRIRAAQYDAELT